MFWVGLLLGGVAMAIWASTADHFPADIAVGRWIQEKDVAGQEVIDVVREFGSPLAGFVAILLVVAVLGVRRQPWMAVAAASFLLGFVLQVVLKDVVDRPRTSVFFLEQRTGFGDESYPSGHAMSDVLAGGLVLYLSVRIAAPVWLRGVPAVWALGVVLLNPRVAVTGGVHWPSDALGGLVWGLIIVIPGLLLLERARKRDVKARAGIHRPQSL